MRLKQLEVKNFRGIRELTWTVDARYVCLVGAGDSTKSTILESIDFVLSPRWRIPFDDSDFYLLDTESPISITATVGDLPTQLLSDARFGHHVRGWSKDSQLHDEPEYDDELVLSIRLQVDQSLEPVWTVYTDRNTDPPRISASDRGKLDCLSIGMYLDRHLSWCRGSVLSRITATEGSIEGLLAGSGRAALRSFEEIEDEALEAFAEAARSAEASGNLFGVAAKSGFRPHLDIQAVTVREAAISLHDGAVPVRRSGLGTRRLLVAAIQCKDAALSGLTLIDELEHGLDPHRLRRLLRVLRGGDMESARQVIVTSHSPIALGELRSSEVQVVRSKDGCTTVTKVDDKLQRFLRKSPEAFLGRKILICEGKTELGLCRELDEYWDREHGEYFALLGVVLADGGGADAPASAMAFTGLAYDTLLLCDSDNPMVPDREALENAGVTVLQWADGLCVEQRIFMDLPWEGVASLLDTEVGNRGATSIIDSIAGRMGIGSEVFADVDTKEWLNLGLDEGDLRRAIGTTADKNKWYKRVDLASGLGRVIGEHYASLEGTDLRIKLDLLRAWATNRV